MYFKKILSLGILLVITAGILSRDRAVSLDESNQQNRAISMSTNKPVEPTNKSTSNGSELNNVVTSQTQFGIKLFQEAIAVNPQANTFISPFSVGIALSMLYNGANGATQQELASLLELMNLSVDKINQGNKLLTEILENSDPDTRLAIANSLWTKLGFSVKQSFLATNQKYYNAEIQELDFNQPEAVNIINSWVATNTQNKIPGIIDRIDPERALFLINAIYFKGQWQNKFNPDNTTEENFSLADGRTIEHPLMSITGKYEYYENAELQMISLPYGSGRLGMNIFLPKQNYSLANFLQQLNYESLNGWLEQMRFKDGSLKMPRFQQEYEIQLNQILEKLGASSMFDGDRANFEALTTENVAVDTIKHKAVIEVNEEGTEAAATTSIGVGITSVTTPFNMIVNRPFFYTIQDSETGAILFMGTVQNPQS